MEDNRVYVQGTKDNLVTKRDHSYIIVEVLKCEDQNRNKTIVNGLPIDPPCAIDREIEEWTKFKQVIINVFN